MANRGFENFDFANNPEWTRYYESLSPAPPTTKLHQIKQNWYKEHIDPNYNPSSASSRSVNPRPSVSSLQKLQALLFVLSLPGLFIGKGHHLIILGHLVGLLHYHSFPKLNLNYWRPVLGDDNLHSIAFLLLFFLIPSTLWIIPAYLGTFVYVPEVITNLSLPNKIKEVALNLDKKKMVILQTRSDCEAWVGFALTLTSIIGYSHWIAPIIYWQYARMRYMLNYFSKITYTNIRIKGDSVLTGKPGIGRMWEKLKDFCNWLCAVEPNQSNNSSCQVF